MDTSNTIRELEATKKEILNWVSQIDSTINTLRLVSSFSHSNGQSSNGIKENGNTLPDKYKEYNKEASTKNKVALVLRKENRFLHIRQIAKILNELEPTIEVKDWISKLYPAFADLKKTGTILKYSIGTSNVNSFWGSKNWLDENGNPKSEHKYDEDQVTDHATEPIEI